MCDRRKADAEVDADEEQRMRDHLQGKKRELEDSGKMVFHTKKKKKKTSDDGEGEKKKKKKSAAKKLDNQKLLSFGDDE